MYLPFTDANYLGTYYNFVTSVAFYIDTDSV